MVSLIRSRTGEFQSALPRGERRNAEVIAGSDTGISIRAPARGATSYQSHGLSLQYFNPRSREGSDLTAMIHSCLSIHFNPRSREGSDVTGFSDPIWDEISIRAPARGATW